MHSATSPVAQGPILYSCIFHSHRPQRTTTPMQLIKPSTFMVVSSVKKLNCPASARGIRPKRTQDMADRRENCSLSLDNVCAWSG